MLHVLLRRLSVCNPTVEVAAEYCIALRNRADCEICARLYKKAVVVVVYANVLHLKTTFKALFEE